MPTTPPVHIPGVRQPRILDRFIDGFGQLHVIDEDGETVLTRPPGLELQNGKIGINPLGGTTFTVGNDWSGGTTEIRWSYSDDAGNNRSYIWNGLYGHTSGFRTYGSGHFAMRIQDDVWQDVWVDVSGSWVLLCARDKWVGHDAAGYGWAQIGVGGGYVSGTSFKSVAGWEDHGFTNYVVAPYAPYDIRIIPDSVRTTSFGVAYGRNSHDPIDQDEAQWALDPEFTQVVWTDTKCAGVSDPSGATPPFQLAPGTLHYVRVRSHTAAGWGGYSATVSQVTLPAVPPGLMVTPFPSGTSATVDLTPPGGVTGVTRYNVEYREPDGAVVETGVDGGNSLTVTALTPGQVYEWRASAVIGTYTSPWTDSTGNPPGTWLSVLQPNPNTSPGDYFDGDTADKPGIDYVWTGDPGLSISQAIGLGVDGWIANFTAPLVGVLHQASGGYAGDSSARVLIQIDGTAAGQLSAGMNNWVEHTATVAEGATYFGSVYVNPSMNQRMRAELHWVDAASNGIVAFPHGEEVHVSKNVWTRLTVTGIAPAGAVGVIVRVTDVPGTGWAAWKSGDALLLDAAMVSLQSLFPYFDGDTPPSAGYVYDWVGTPDASESTRTPVEDSGGFDPLDDPDCPPLPAPPRPPVVPADCIDEVGVWRRYWVQISGDIISDWLAVIPTIYVTTKTKAARQVRIRIYENPDNTSPGAFSSDEWHSEQIVSYIPPNTLITLDGVSHRTWAEVDGTEARPADKLLYGTGGTPATWPVLTCGMPYLMAFDAPLNDENGDPIPPGNITVALALTERMG